MLFNFDLSTVHAKRASNNRPLSYNSFELSIAWMTAVYDFHSSEYIYLSKLLNIEGSTTKSHTKITLALVSHHGKGVVGSIPGGFLSIIISFHLNKNTFTFETLKF